MRGSTHQGNAFLFGHSAGFQCTAIAFYALLFASLMPVSDWTTPVVDSILHEGNDLYNVIIQDHGPFYMGHDNLHNTVVINHMQIEVWLYLDTFSGFTQGDDNPSFNLISLEGAILQSSNISPYFLFTSGYVTIAILFDEIRHF